MTSPPLTVTLDASVIMNAVNPAEVGQATSQQLLTTIQAHRVPVIVPTLVLVEVAATISRVLGDTSQAKAFARHVGRLPAMRFVPLSRALALAAADLAADHRLRGADSVYATVAQRYSTTLISLDGEHLRRLTGIVPVLTPTEALATLWPPSEPRLP